MYPRNHQVKEEYSGGGGSFASSSWPPQQGIVVMEDGAVVEQPRPMEGLHDMGPPPFLMKTFEMVDDSISDGVVSWSRGGNSFVVWNTHDFSTCILPRYFKHNNFSSFVRQLNTYGFRKVDPDKWEFANEAFLRGQKHLLKNISRRKTPSNQPFDITPHHDIGPSVEMGADAKIDRLKREKQVLVMELMTLREQQQNTRTCLHQMDLRLQRSEKKQQQAMCFLARAMQNPDFVQQLIKLKEKRKKLEEDANKKRSRPIETGESSQWNERGKSAIKYGPLEYGDLYGFDELSELALKMQGFSKGRRDEEQEEIELLESYDRELDDRFWEELLNEGFDEETETPKTGEGKEENINVLVNRLEFLGSSPKYQIVILVFLNP